MTQAHSGRARRATHLHVGGGELGARVRVSWISQASVASCKDSAEFELDREFDLSSGLFAVAARSGWTWVDTLARTQCTEVVLTAAFDEGPAKHRLLALAELLTIELAARQGVVRVRFLPSKRRALDREAHPSPRASALSWALAR